VADVSKAVSAADVATGIAGHLAKSSMPDNLVGCREERPFRRWVGERAREWVSLKPDKSLTVRIEPDEGGVQAVGRFGTSFWPDVSVELGDSPAFLAVEVKCLARRGLPGHVAQSLGQALLYIHPYQRSLVVFILLEPLDPAVLAEITDMLNGFSVTVAYVEAFQ
jgi:hypothetical protein